MAVLTVQTPASTGSALSLTAAAAGGDKYPNSGKEMFVVTNGGGAPIDVTFVAQATCNLGSVHTTGSNGPHTVAAGATRYFPGQDAARFNDADGRVNVTYSGVTTVTVGVMRTT